ncbi:MAG: TetR/AcrR family transcriptional regulator [Oscillospiraceae bacterium]|nr:TetR/AcrR family transcriptional regulator [Oscillospiraceae bacterium]
MYKICHTEESSRRQRELENGLLKALEKQPYDKITLTGLCRELNIPRKTFYRYFPTKEDCLLALIDHALSDCNDHALLGWNGGRSLDGQAQLRFFRYWRKQEALLDAIQNNGLQNLLLERTTVIVDRMKENTPPYPFAREQTEYFIAHGLMFTVIRWHQFGFPDTPEEMAKVFEELLGHDRVSLSRLLL